MLHVFVETNWVVDYAAPANYQVQAAADLLHRAEQGEIRLYLPAICLAEARYPLLTKPKFQPKKQADILREFLRWARSQGKVSQQEAETVYRILDLFEGYTRIEPDNLESRLHSLRHQSGLEIFPLNQAMLDRAVELSFQNLGLEPFDQAILAAVLVRAEQLIAEGAEQLAFCELDSDLQPWDKKGDNKPLLAELYRPLPIAIYNNFLLQHPQWPK